MAGQDIASNIMSVANAILNFCWSVLKSLFYYPMMFWEWLPVWVHYVVYLFLLLLMIYFGFWLWYHRDDWREIAG